MVGPATRRACRSSTWATSSIRPPWAIACDRAWDYTGGSVPLLVTENGIGTTDDAQRIDYVRQALSGVLQALDDGVDVRGYTYWSLLDNFEWAMGYRPKFGIVGVDRESFARTPKPSATWLAGIAAANALDV